MGEAAKAAAGTQGQTARKAAVVNRNAFKPPTKAFIQGASSGPRGSRMHNNRTA